jgi:CHAT domain-containing protein
MVILEITSKRSHYTKAEALYKRSLAINEEALGLEHPYIAYGLGSLAMLYKQIGDYAKVESLYKKALAIREKALGTDHPKVADSLRSLALLYGDLGDYVKEESQIEDYAKAEALYKKALTITEKALGTDHPRVATELCGLGSIHENLGDYVRAEALYERALTIREKALGPEHPYVITPLACLATLYDKLGNYTKAEASYKRALIIYEKIFGPESYRLAPCLTSMARHYANKDDFEQSLNVFKRAQNIEAKFIDHLMGITSEKQKIKLLSKYKPHLHIFLSLINQLLSQNPSARKDAFNIWLKRKGVILEAQKRFQEALIYSDDPEAIKTFQELSRVRSQLSRLTFADTGKQDLDTYKKRIAYLESQKQELEAKLSRLSQAFALSKKVAKADCEKIARSLPNNTVLIDFAKVDMFNFKAKGKEKKWNPPHYLAFVLHSGKGDKVGMIDLGDAEEIDKAVTRFKKEISSIKDVKDGKPIKSSGKVYDLVFQPLKKELGDIKEIFISPDGNLNLIPFEVLQGPDGRYLIEDYTFNYLAAGRDLLGFGQIKSKGDTALLMGDPDFDMGTDEKSSTLRKLALAKVDHKDLARRSSDMKGLHFRRLPGARQEVKVIRTILGKDKSELYTDKEALEEVLRHSGTPSILHLATHGFFLKDQELDNIPSDPTARGFDSFSMPIKRKRIKVKIENPMLRSGFALAGANRSLHIMDEQTDDGIVTSEEILGLRLRGTDMVVLSACDTGLGDVSTGEGIFGLRRAFAQAGAKSLVMSMWSVPDKETRELMVEFYKNIKSGKMNRCQALRQAALKEMKIVKERYGHAYPICWGGFVMVGDPGQLN